VMLPSNKDFCAVGGPRKDKPGGGRGGNQNNHLYNSTPRYNAGVLRESVGDFWMEWGKVRDGGVHVRA
jgi:hypothetical protein